MNSKNTLINLVKAAEYLGMIILSVSLTGMISFSGYSVRSIIGNSTCGTVCGMLAAASLGAFAVMFAAKAGEKALEK